MSPVYSVWENVLVRPDIRDVKIYFYIFLVLLMYSTFVSLHIYGVALLMYCTYVILPIYGVALLMYSTYVSLPIYGTALLIYCTYVS